VDKIQAQAQDNAPAKAQAQTAAGSSDESTALSSSDREDEETEDATPEGVMLRSVSYALLSCSLLQKACTPGQEKAPLTRAEVMKERSRIFRTIAPVEMSLHNLSRALSCFGIARRNAVERVSSYLSSGISRVISGEVERRHGGQGGIPFVVFYRLMRALHGNARPSSRMLSGPPSSTFGALRGQRLNEQADKPTVTLKSSAEWPESELLRRLMFAVLVGWVGPAATNSVPEKRAAYATPVALSVAGLQNSLRMLLCTAVLLEVDVDHTGAGRVLETTQGVSIGAAGTELLGLTELLLSEMLRSEAEEADSAAERPGAATATTGFVTFHGFERFVSRFPGVFTGLVLLLMPLASQAADYMAEELEIGHKKGSMHRAGELRATITAQTQAMQRRQFEAMHRNFTQPWLAARVIAGDGSSAAASGCGGERTFAVPPKRA